VKIIIIIIMTIIITIIIIIIIIITKTMTESENHVTLDILLEMKHSMLLIVKGEFDTGSPL